MTDDIERRRDCNYIFSKLEQSIKLQQGISDKMIRVVITQENTSEKMIEFCEKLEKIEEQIEKIEEQSKTLEKSLDARLLEIERYFFAGKVVFWGVSICAATVAGVVHFWNDVRDAIK